MNKIEFLRVLEENLSKLPIEERQSAIEYYEEYLDEAGSENEEEAVRRLGSPVQLAKQLMADFITKEVEEKPMKPKQSFQAFWIVIVALFASPIALPVALSIAGLGFGAIVTVGSLLFAGCIVAVVFLVVAIILGGVGIGTLFVHPASGIVVIGVGCVLLGIGILISVLVYVVVGKGIPTIIKGITKLGHKAKGRKQIC